MLIEGLLLLLLLSLGSERQFSNREAGISVINLEAEEVSEKALEPSSPVREQRAEERPEPQRAAAEQPLPSQPTEPSAAPTARTIIPTPAEGPPSTDIPRNATRPAPSGRPLFGPPDRGGSSSFRDSERVGTAPNGEPLYAAAWHREPRAGDLRGYLSTARGPGWGLIACRTAPGYRVEDCVGLSEYPTGSQINRAILAAAWEFQVRPPQLGGRPLVGSWVRIRIDYDIVRR